MWETPVQPLDWEDPLEKGKATHSSILAWRIPWTVYSMGSQRVRHDWATFTYLLTGDQSRRRERKEAWGSFGEWWICSLFCLWQWFHIYIVYCLIYISLNSIYLKYKSIISQHCKIKPLLRQSICPISPHSIVFWDIKYNTKEFLTCSVYPS